MSGYKISLSQTDLATLLDSTFLQGVTHFDETDSTNTRSIAWLASDTNVKTPHLVYAESQTSGRGRGANQWWSAAGSLTFSVVIEFEEIGLGVEHRPLLPLLTGMALLRTGQAVIPDGQFALKWPNDVFLAERKLAGILIQVPSQANPFTETSQPCYAVIGVGLNVNNRFSDAPPELKATGISLADASGQPLNRLKILTTFLQHLENSIQSLCPGRESVLGAWPEFCFLTGKQVTLQTGPREVTGLCRGIDPTGALILETDAGPQSYLGGVIKKVK